MLTKIIFHFKIAAVVVARRWRILWCPHTPDFLKARSNPSWSNPVECPRGCGKERYIARGKGTWVGIDNA